MIVNFEELKKEQLHLSQKVVLKDGFKKVKKVAGVDQAFINNTVISCVVVCKYKTMEVLEKQIATAEALIPYKPGFLAYREMPAAIAAYEKLEHEPDVIIVDGHGIAHPRRIGLASHLGLALDKPTIGVAKSLVVGKVENGKIYVENELRGFEFTTKEHAKPIYVSPGHLVSPGTALRIVRESIRPPHKLPEPLHIAHKCVRKETRSKQNI